MRVSIKNISADGVSLAETISAQDLGLEEDVVVCKSPLEIDVYVYRAEDAIIVKGTVSGKYELACGRCLEIFEEDRTDKFDLYIEIDEKTEFLDMEEDVRQEIVVAITSGSSLCREDCKGICPRCGVNLNNEKCQC